MSRMTYRLLVAATVAPFIIFGWVLSVWLSQHAVQAAEGPPVAIGAPDQ